MGINSAFKELIGVCTIGYTYWHNHIGMIYLSYLAVYIDPFMSSVIPRFIPSASLTRNLLLTRLHVYNYHPVFINGDNIEKNKMGGAYSAYGEEKRRIQ